jgi:uncharacterized membrane protein YqiK
MFLTPVGGFSPIPAIVILIITIIVSILTIYYQSLVTIPPEKALVIYGKEEPKKALKYKFFLKGRKYVSRFTQSYGFLPLKVFTQGLVLKDLWTKDQNRVVLYTTLKFQLRTDQDGLERAARNFFKEDDDVIKKAFEAKVTEAAIATIKVHDLKDLEPGYDAISKEWTKLADDGLFPLGLVTHTIHIRDIQSKGVVVTDLPTMKSHLKDLKSELAQLEDKLSTIEKAK